MLTALRSRIVDDWREIHTHWSTWALGALGVMDVLRGFWDAFDGVVPEPWFSRLGLAVAIAGLVAKFLKQKRGKA